MKDPPVDKHRESAAPRGDELETGTRRVASSGDGRSSMGGGLPKLSLQEGASVTFTFPMVSAARVVFVSDAETPPEPIKSKRPLDRAKFKSAWKRR